MEHVVARPDVGGYFDQFMGHVDPGPRGWSGLALPYHLHQGWYGLSPWTVPDAKEALEQLELVLERFESGNAIDSQAFSALVALVELLRTAVDLGVTIQVEYS